MAERRVLGALLHPEDTCRCVMLFDCLACCGFVCRKWRFYSELPVECHNGIMVMTAGPHATEGKSLMRN